MLVKWIICEVPAERRDAFARAQSRWGALAALDGFLSQVGGWMRSTSPPGAPDGDATPGRLATSERAGTRGRAGMPGGAAIPGLWRDRAAILGLWRDRAAYGDFMRHHHDRIASETELRPSYSSIRVQVLDGVFEMAGGPGETADAFVSAERIHGTSYRLNASRAATFAARAAAYWPGAVTPGLGGVIVARTGGTRRARTGSTRHTRAATDSHVFTAWDGSATHAADPHPDLDTERDPGFGRDVVARVVVDVVAAWRVRSPG